MVGRPLYFSARTTSGEELHPAICDPTGDGLWALNIREGQTVRGTVAFDVPTGSRIDVIELRGVIGKVLAEWKA